MGYFQMLTDPISPAGYSYIKYLTGVSERYLIHVMDMSLSMLLLSYSQSVFVNSFSVISLFEV